MADTRFFATATGTVVQLDVPVEGTFQRDWHDAKVESGELAEVPEGDVETVTATIATLNDGTKVEATTYRLRAVSGDNAAEAPVDDTPAPAAAPAGRRSRAAAADSTPADAAVDAPGGDVPAEGTAGQDAAPAATDGAEGTKSKG